MNARGPGDEIGTHPEYLYRAVNPRKVAIADSSRKDQDRCHDLLTDPFH